MPISFFRFLLGYVKFSFTGGFADKFVNECFLRNINIKNIIYKENALYAEASIKSYRALHRIALKCGGTVKISKKCGLPFLLAPLKGRWGFFAGILFFVLFISYMGGFVWNITVIGNNRLAEAKIVDYLAQNGFKTGCRWANVDKENLEFEILSDFDEVAWVSINKLGCLAQIEISESVPKPDIVDSGRITNVKASKDGVIVHVTALGGWPEVREGDAVAKGDLLISGVFESEVDKKNHFAHLRNVSINDQWFNETSHESNAGSLDMYEIVKALQEAGFDGYIRPDHGRMIWGEVARPGYGLYDRALGVSYLNGLWEAVEKSRR